MKKKLIPIDVNCDENGLMYPATIPLMSKVIDNKLYEEIGATWNSDKSVWLLNTGQENVLNLTDTEYSALPSLIADSYFVAESDQKCWKCDERTKVYCLACQVHMSVEVKNDIDFGGDDRDYIFGCLSAHWTTLSNCNAFDDDTEKLLKLHFPKYRKDFSKTQDKHVFMNHCGNCDAKLGDFFMHSEPGGAFFPMSYEEVEKISLRPVMHRLLVQAASSYSTDSFLDVIRPGCAIA